MSDAEWHRNNIIDTQIISYAMKNRWPRGIEPRDISQAAISSVTAHELLEVRSADKVNSPRYYLYSPLVPEVIGDERAAKKFDRDHRRINPGRKHQTDQVILDFSGDFPAMVEYGHLMIGWILKYKRIDVYARRIAHLDKRERRRLTNVFSYLVENDLRCISLDRTRAQLGVNLLRKYSTSAGNNLKEDFRNSLNDMLILATAIDSATDLITEDRALWRFAVRTLCLPIRAKEDLIRLDVSSGVAKSTVSRESKGYINRPWEARVRGRNVPA